MTGYHPMRMAALRRSLGRALRRWGVWLMVLGLVLGSGADGDPLAVLAGAPALAWWPLLQADGAAQLALRAVGLAGGLLLPLLLTRPWWWPARWQAADRALPWPAAELARSDRRVVAWLLLPGATVMALGLVGLLIGGAWHAAPTLPAAVGAAALALLLAAGLGMAGLRWLRRRAARVARSATVPGQAALPRSGPARGPAQPLPRRARPARALPWWRPLVWQALWRPGARGLLGTLALAALCPPALAAGPWALLPVADRPGATGIGLALLAVASGVLVARLRAQLQQRAARTAQADAALPLPPGSLARAHHRLALLPAAWAALAAPAALAIAVRAGALPPARPAVLAAYAASLLLAAWLEAAPPPAQAADHAARHLLLATIGTVLGLEVLP